MGILSFLFGSDEDRLQAAVQKAKNISERINGCLTVSDGISEPDELAVLVSEAKNGLKEIKSICNKYPKISIGNLDAFENKIRKIELRIDGYNEPLSNNLSFNDEAAAVQCIESNLRIINESIEIVKITKSEDTRISRLDLASSKLYEARGLALKYNIDVSGFDIAEAEIKYLKDNMIFINESAVALSGNHDVCPSRELLKEAVALKKEKKYSEACDILRKAYLAEGSEILMVEERLRLPMYLQLAGENDEGWLELNRLLKENNDPCSHPRILGQMDVFLRKEGNPNATNPVRVIENVDTPEPSAKNSQYMMELWQDRPDIICGLEFCATMQLRTPLRVLRRHGELHSDRKSPPPIYIKEPWEGIWYPTTKTWKELGIDLPEPPSGMMASDVGEVPQNGGVYLPFIIKIRQIVEQDLTIVERISILRNCNFSKIDRGFIEKHDGLDKIIDRFFPKFLDLGPNLNTPNKITAAPDQELLSIRGIGPAKLKKIRDKCAGITVGRDFDRLDNVRR